MNVAQFLLVGVLWALVVTVCPEVHTVWKCCGKGMQFAEDEQSCVNVQGMKPSSPKVEILIPPINESDYYWLPTNLLSKHVVAHYNSLSGIIMNITAILYYDETLEYKFLDSHAKLDFSMVLDKRYCFETIHNNRTRVQIMSIELAPIYKCCSKNQKLNSTGKCESVDHIPENTIKEEVVNKQTSNKDSLSWLPNNISQYTLRVKYNLLVDDLATDIMLAEGSEFRWDILTSDSNGIRILFRGLKLLGSISSGMTDVFCFDEIAYNSSIQKVLVVAKLQTKPIHLSKCCAKNSFIDVKSDSCDNTHETGASLSESVELDSSVDNKTFNWIPYPFKLYPLAISYDTLSNYSSGFIVTKLYSKYADVLAPNSNMKPIFLPMIQDKLLCFDKNSSGSKIAKEYYNIKPIFKCCSKGERLNSVAERCESVPGQIPDRKLTKSLEIYPWNSESLTWLPPMLRKFSLSIEYNILSLRIPFNYKVSEKNYTRLTFSSTFPEMNELILESQDASGKKLSIKSFLFCFDEVAEGQFSPRVTLAFVKQRVETLQDIRKCCNKGQVLDIESKSCVDNKNSVRVEIETLADKMDHEIYQWIPQSQKYPVTVHYNTLNSLDSDVRRVVAEETENTSEKSINPALIWRETSCYDWSAHPPSRVRVIGYKLKPISKCCPKNHRLTLEGLCVRIPGAAYENVVEEIVYPGNSVNVSWLPSIISYAVKVRYSHFKTKFGHNVIYYEDLGNVWGFTSTSGYTSAMYISLNSDLPRNISRITDAFCFEQMVEGATSPRILVARFPKQIWKCCLPGMEISNDTKSCVAKLETDAIDQNNAYDLYLPNINTFNSWIPDEYKNFPLSIKYDMLSQVKFDFSATVLYVKPRSVFLEGSIVHSGTISNEEVCYDNFQLYKNVQAVITTYALKLLYKCCPKGERLTHSAKGCERLPGHVPENVAQEIIEEWKVRDHNWIPQNFSKVGVKVGYNYLKFGYVPNVVEREDKIEWKIIPGMKSRNVISFRGQGISGEHLEGISEHFCFDEVAEGPLAPRAFLATTYIANKCCKRGEYLVNGDITCAPYQGRTVDEVINGVVNWTRDPLDTYWLPEALKNVTTPALYNYLAKVFYSQISGMIYDESVWKLDYGPDRLSRIVVNSTDLSGKPFVMEVDAYCFDFLEDSKVILNYLSPISNSQFVRKCCYPGEILSSRGKCKKYNGTDWSPGISTFKDKFLSSNCKDNIQIPVKRFCAYSTFQIHSPTSARALRYFRGDSFDNAKYSSSMYCNDWQEAEGGALSEVVASCTFPAYAWEYESVRPLGAAAAALLLTSLVVTLVQRETRRTAHGRALACHALCLAAANITQVAAHFVHPGTDNCRPYAYTAYFFIIAANCWLTSITFNMFLNFRQPLGALAKGARSDARAAVAAWRRFAALSAFSWLTAGALTAFAATVYHFSRTDHFYADFIVPSFFETRTCLFEDFIGLYHKPNEDPQEMTFYNTWGAVCYYYIPAAILVVTNAIFVVLTMIRIRGLKKGTSVLRRDTKESSCLPSQHLQMALFYAKLLLATGVLELTVEGALWTSGRQWHPGASAGSGAYFLPKVNQFLLSIFATVVDFLRAISVFWLATRGWSLPGRAWGWIKGRLVVAWGWIKRRLVGAWGRVRKILCALCASRAPPPIRKDESQDLPEENIVMDESVSKDDDRATSTAGCENNAYDTSDATNNSNEVTPTSPSETSEQH